MAVPAAIKKCIPDGIKNSLIYHVNKYRWQKKQFPKLKTALWDDSVGYFFRQFGIGSKFKELKKFRNKYQGKRCFIIATGPSLTMEDVEMLKNEYTFAVNSMVNVMEKMSYIPTFYAIQDGFAYERLRDKIKATTLNYAFIADWKMKKEYFSDKEWIQYPLTAWDYFNAYPEASFEDKVSFSDDAFKRVYDGFSITYSALQLAVYMGFKEIYLLGSDCNYEKGVKNFAEYRDEKHMNACVSNGERMIRAFEVAAKWAEAHDVKIYNATRGGMLEAFERVTLEDVLTE
jgi:hypothetical protein